MRRIEFSIPNRSIRIEVQNLAWHDWHRDRSEIARLQNAPALGVCREEAGGSRICAAARIKLFDFLTIH
jgi:hypothetical protein